MRGGGEGFGREAFDGNAVAPNEALGERLGKQVHIAFAIAQGGTHGDDVETKVQVLPKLVFSTLCSSLRLVAATTRTSTLIVRLPPTRSNSRSCSTRSSCF